MQLDFLDTFWADVQDLDIAIAKISCQMTG